MKEYKLKKFDIQTEDNTVIHGIIYLEKPSFNYLEELSKKNKSEEIKKLKIFREKICTGLRINKIDMLIDERKYRLLTSRKIVVKYRNDLKKLGLIPAISEETEDKIPLEIEIEFL